MNRKITTLAMSLVAVYLGSFLQTSNAQSGISRATASQPGSVQPVATPVLAAGPSKIMAPPAVSTPGVNGPMPTPLPGGVMAPLANLKEESINKIAPLSAQEIIDLRKELEVRANAMAEPIGPVAKPVRRLVTIDMSPGSSPEIVRVSFGHGSVVTFLDAAGRPWPVIAADNFNQRGLDVAVLGINGLSIGVKTAAARAGNIAVQLEGIPSPITFAVAIGQLEVDYNVEMQVPKYLPGLAAPVGSVEKMPSLGAPELLNYLLGAAPKESRVLQVSAANVKAWQVTSETMIIRTDALLASPRYSRRQSSAAGVTVYEVPVSAHVILASQGQMQPVTIAGFSATKEQK